MSTILPVEECFLAPLRLEEPRRHPAARDGQARDLETAIECGLHLGRWLLSYGAVRTRTGEDLILAWPLGRIDYEHFHRSLPRFQLEAQIRQGGEDGWPIGAR